MELVGFFNSVEELFTAILSLYVEVHQLRRTLPFVFRRAVNQRIAFQIMIAASPVLFAAIILVVRNPKGS